MSATTIAFGSAPAVEIAVSARFDQDGFPEVVFDFVTFGDAAEALDELGADEGASVEEAARLYVDRLDDSERRELAEQAWGNA